MAITKYLSVLQEDFALYGEHQGEWQPFEKGKTYSAFLAHSIII